MEKVVDTRLAKALAASIRRALRESGVPVKHLDATVNVVTDDDHSLNLRIGGVPPFTTAEVVIDGKYIGGFIGHPDVES